MLLSDLVDLIKKGNSNFISANIFEDLNIDDAASLDNACLLYTSPSPRD